MNADAVIPSRDQVQGLLVPADFSHVDELARTMLPLDQDMCRNAGYEPKEAVYAMLLPALNKFTYVAGGHVAAMFGTVARPRYHHLAEAEKRTPDGQLWCFTGANVGRAPLGWVNKFKFAVRELLGHFDALHSHIDVRNEQMIRLAKYVGGELEGPFPFGAHNRLFWKYVVRS